MLLLNKLNISFRRCYMFLCHWKWNWNFFSVFFFWVGRGWRKSYNQHSTHKTEPSKNSSIYFHIDVKVWFSLFLSVCVCALFLNNYSFILQAIKMRVNQFFCLLKKNNIQFIHFETQLLCTFLFKLPYLDSHCL